MTVTADNKKRVVIPGGAPGDVYVCEQTDDGVILRRVYRHSASDKKKMSRAEVLRAIQNWKFIPAISWEELRKLTREP